VFREVKGKMPAGKRGGKAAVKCPGVIFLSVIKMAAGTKKAFRLGKGEG
jgi:hypothetical protein